MEPKISIVTPVYNSSQYIEKCIKSIVGQTYQNYEHIIMDGGSTDGTIEIIDKYLGEYPVKLVSEADEGMYDAINKGFSRATGEILCWLNADDYYFPWTLQVVKSVFTQKKIDWLTGIPSNTIRYGNEELIYLMPNLPTVYCTSLIKRGCYDGKRMYFVQQESCFFSKKLWQKSGGLKPQYKMAGDYHLWREFAKYTKLYTVHCNLASFRIHEGQKSADRDAYYTEIGKVGIGTKFGVFIQMYCHLYSLCYYRKYVVNLEEIMSWVIK